MKKGFNYLAAIIDLQSRHVFNWSVSNLMDAMSCQHVLEEAIQVHGKPEIFNTDQGSQFISEIFSSYVLAVGIKLSIDVKGRAINNVFIKRLWRSVKYEKIYLNPPSQGTELYLQLAEYFSYYNNQRRQLGLEKRIPAQLYSNMIEKAA